MKEPLIVDFLEQFLAEHNISNQPSRPASVRSYRSNRSLSPMNGHSPKPPGSPSSLTLTAAAAANHHHRLSVRLSQAELLEYSHQQQQQRLSSVPTTPTSSSHSIKSQAMGLPPPSPVRSTSPVVGPVAAEGNTSRKEGGGGERLDQRRRLSRGTSLASLDGMLTNL